LPFPFASAPQNPFFIGPSRAGLLLAQKGPATFYIKERLAYGENLFAAVIPLSTSRAKFDDRARSALAILDRGLAAGPQSRAKDLGGTPQSVTPPPEMSPACPIGPARRERVLSSSPSAARPSGTTSAPVSSMAAANASARGQRAVHPRQPGQLTRFLLAVDCPARGCNGRAQPCRGGAGELLRPGLQGRTGAASHAVLRRLWRARGAAWLVTARQAAAGAAVGAGGEAERQRRWEPEWRERARFFVKHAGFYDGFLLDAAKYLLIANRCAGPSPIPRGRALNTRCDPARQFGPSALGS
jgi:hypothetical protein